MPTTIYEYGLLAPTENESLVRDLIGAAHAHRNRLVEIERGRRAQMRDFEQRFGSLQPLETEVRAREDEVAQLYKTIRTARAQSRSRSETGEMREALWKAKGAKRAALDALREARRGIAEDPQAQLARDAINEENSAQKRAARAAFPDFVGRDGQPIRVHVHQGAWGSFQRPEAAAEKSHADLPLYVPGSAVPNNPRFQRFDGTGSVGLQIQGGLAVPIALSGESSKLSLRTVDDGVRKYRRDDGQPGRRVGRRWELRLRIGSDAEDRPVWGVWSMILHRPLPPDALIMQVVVFLSRIASRERWRVQLTLRHAEPLPKFVRAPDGTEQRDRCPAEGAVAIDIGWRQLPDGSLRVARWAGSDGRAGEWRLESTPGVPRSGRTPRGEPRRGKRHGSALDQQRSAQALRAGRQKDFEVARDALGKRLGAMAALPDWLAQALEGTDTQGNRHPLSDSRSPARLAKLARQWTDRRFDGDELAFTPLRDWARNDRHLWDWERSQSERALRRRKDQFRCWGAALARQYHTVVWEDFDLTRIARRAPTGDNERENETARTNRHAAALSELRSVVTHAFIARSGEAAKVDPYQSTHICHICGSVESFDAAALIAHRCDGCGAFIDQDDSASRVLLARFEQDRDTKSEGARKENDTKESKPMQESPRARSRRLASERRRRLDAAREGSSNDAQS